MKTEPVVVKQLSPKLMPLMEMNPETVGWLTIPGTSTDYPVVQAQDNEQFIQDIASRSLHPSEVTVNKDDTIITLSTCAAGYDTMRFAVHAKLIKQVEYTQP